MEALFKQMVDFAKENKVPIINENGRKVFIEIIKKDVALKQSYVFFILHYYNFRDLFLIIIFLILLVFFLWGFFHEERTQLIQTVER